MTLTRAWLRIEWRRSATSLVVLFVLVAVSSGCVMAAVAGVRRAASAQARLAEVTRPADVLVVPQGPLDLAAVRRLPEVAAMDIMTEFGLTFDGVPVASGRGYSPAVMVLPYGGQLLRDVERPVVLAGRLPDPRRADEAAVTTGFVRAFHRGLGDTVHPGIDSQVRRRGDVGLLPARIRIVGLIRSPLFSDDSTSRGRIVLTPALGALFGRVAADAFEAPIVRLRSGPFDLAAFGRDLEAVPGSAGATLLDTASVTGRRQHVLVFENRFLLAFAGSLLLTAVVLIGQAVSRAAGTVVEALHPMRAVGFTPPQILRLAAIAPALAGCLGALAGAAIAAAASGLFPLGSAAAYDPSPGLRLDPVVLVPGAVLSAAGVGLGALLAGWLALLAAGRGDAGPARSRVADRLAAAGLPVPVVLGSRLALERRSGRQVVTVRSAQIGSVLGVLGVVAALTFSAAVGEAVTNRARFGQTFDLSVTLGGDGSPGDPAVLAALAADRDVVSVDDSASTGGTLVGHGPDIDLLLDRHRPSSGRPAVVMLDGRLPQSADEVALGPETAQAAAVDIGDRVRLRGTTERALTVTGLGLLPESFRGSYAEGAWLTSDGFDAVAPPAEGVERTAFVALRRGADARAVASRLDAAMQAAARPAAAAPSTGSPSSSITLAGIEGLYTAAVEQDPVRIGEVRRVLGFPIVLGAFLAVLATAAVGFALAAAVRRRRPEFAVLRAVGMTPRQARAAIVMQAVVLAVLGLAFGTPLGLGVGRTLWRLVAQYTPLQYAAPGAWPLVAVLIPVVLALAVVLAARPGLQAGRFRLADALRAE